MVSEFKWTTESAVGDFVRLLEQARKLGPQEIYDESGVYVLRVQEDATKEDAAKFLLKARPSG